MSELTNNQNYCSNFRRKFLKGASFLALTAYVLPVSPATAEDDSKPQVWIELGGQLSRLTDGQEAFAPSAFASRPAIFSRPEKFEKKPGYSLDEYGLISFQPKGADWSFSASIRYGRSVSTQRGHQQTYPEYGYFPSAVLGKTAVPVAARFSDTKSRNAETHAILDFMAGKDVGLGLFGNGSSTISLGVRFAQFTSKSNITLRSDPDWRFQAKYFTYYSAPFKLIVQPYHSNAGMLVANQSFRGLGPAVSWKSSIPLAGDSQDNELDFDWGINAAVLFGRQKARTEHQTTVRYNDGGTGVISQGSLATVSRNVPPASVRSRSVVVPNIGGFAALSFRYDAAKVGFGYKADFFFGAMDGGIDTRKAYDRNFYGPFATVSIGLGG